MSPELEKKLVEDFPHLYRDDDENEEGSELIIQKSIEFYFEVEDGWYDLIRELSEKVSRIDPDAIVVQVKEKFGGLRWYVNGNEETMKLELEYEEKSYKICETCGKEGKIRDDLGWSKTLCESHYAKFIKEVLRKK